MKKALLLVLLVSLFSFVALAEKIELNFWTHEDPNRTLLEDRYILEFQQMYPDVVINRVTYSSVKIQELILTAFSANQGPDIFNMSIEDEYAYVANGRVAPVDWKALGYKNLQEVYDAYLPGMLDSVTFEGELYGLPLELTNWCIMLNKKVFKDAGLDPEKDYPKTWEEMAEVSEKLIIKDGEILQRRGFDFRYPYYLVSVVPMVEQLGGKLVSDDGKEAIINDAAWLKVLNYFKDWGPNGKNLGSPTYKSARKLFNADNNDIAMCLTGLYQEGRIRAENPDFYDSGEWMVVPFPVFEDAVADVPCCYYGHFYMVNYQKPRKNQEMAWKFIDYMLSHGDEYLDVVNIIQPTKALMESELFKSMPYSAVFADDMAKGHVVYYHANSAKIQELIKQAVESVMLLNESPESALKKLREKVQEDLDEEF